MISKNSNYCETIRQIITQYANEPQRKHEGKDMWQRAMNLEEGDSEDCRIQGPIGHLINSLYEIGMEIESDLNISCSDTGMNFNLYQIPWNHIKKIIFQQTSIKRCERVARDRTFCGQLSEIETGVLKSIINSLDGRERNSFCHIATGGFWHEGQLQQIGLSQGKCVHCGQTNIKHTHILWDCPKNQST